MSLGILAVGIVIFAIVATLLGIAINGLAKDDFNGITFGIVLGIVLMVCLYCAISGTYFLYLAGKIWKNTKYVYSI